MINFAVFLSVFLLVSCATEKVRLKDGTIVEVKKSHEDAYKNLEQKYKKGEFKKVILEGRTFINNTEDSGIFFKVYNLIGLSHAQVSEYQDSIKAFNNALKDLEEGGMRNTILFNKAKVQSLINDQVEVVKTLDEIVLDKSNLDDQARYLKLKLDSLNKTGANVQTVTALGDLIDVSNKMKVEHHFNEEMDDKVGKLTIEDLSQLKNSSKSRTVLTYVYDRLIVLNERDKKFKEAGFLKLEKARRLGDISSLEDDQTLSQNVGAVINIQRVTFRPKTIGIILSLTGDKSSKGRTIQTLLEQIHSLGDPELNLVIKDNHSTDEGSVAAAKELIEEGIGVLMGPFNTQHANAIKNYIQQTNAVYVSFALNKNFKPENRIFQFYVPPEQQVRRVLEYGVQNLNVQNIALVRSRDEFGAQWEEAFWTAIKGLPIRVKGYGLYEPRQTDFITLIDDISGASDTLGRQNEWMQLNSLREAKERATGKKSKDPVMLEPKPAFDSLFIPDDAKVAGQIIPSLKFRDLNKIHILGPALLDDEDLIKRAGRNVDGVVFCDLIAEKPKAYMDLVYGVPEVVEEKTEAEKTDPAKDGKKAKAKIEPSKYFHNYEAIAFLSYTMFEKLFQSQSYSSWDELYRELQDGQSFPTSTIPVKQTENVLTSQLSILTIKGGKIVPLN